MTRRGLEINESGTSAEADNDRAALLGELDRAAGTRIRDIVLSDAMKTRYNTATWRDQSRATQAWLKAVVCLNALSCAIDYLQAPEILWLGIAMRIGFLPIVYAGLFLVWSKPRQSWIKGLTLPIACGALMIVAGTLAMAAGGLVYERYIGAGLAAAATAVIIFGVERIWAIVATLVCLGMYLGFGLGNPVVDPLTTVLLTIYYGCLMSCLIPAREAMNLVRLRSFMMTLRSTLQADALSAANDSLAMLATTDGLTGLCNRRAIETRLASDWAKQSAINGCVGIALVDVDLFKRFNDSAGHKEGDICLVAIARAIASVMPADALAGRYGGEEFIAIVPGATPRTLAAIGEKIRSAVAEMQMNHPGLDRRNVSVSVGIALAVAGGDSARAQDVIRAADGALYHAKAEGRDRVVASWDEAPHDDLDTSTPTAMAPTDGYGSKQAVAS